MLKSIVLPDIQHIAEVFVVIYNMRGSNCKDLLVGAARLNIYILKLIIILVLVIKNSLLPLNSVNFKFCNLMWIVSLFLYTEVYKSVIYINQ